MSLTAGQLFLSSYNNQDNETSTDFSIQLSVPVTKAKRLRLLAATIPNLFMPFAANDRQWTFSVAGASYTMTFPTTSRWATINDFIAYCNAATTGLFATAVLTSTGTPTACPVTLSYNASTNKLTITTNSAGQVIIMPPWNWNNTQGTSVSYNSNYRLGWTNSRPVSGTTTLTADGFPNVFNRSNVLYVVTNIAASSNNDNNIGNVLGRIPVNIGWGGVINYENVATDFAGPVFSENFKEVRIQVLDEDYQPITQPQNAYFSLVIGVHYE
jgi:hypothetical protein